MIRTHPLAAETAALMATSHLAEDLVAGARDARSLEIIRAELAYRSTRPGKVSSR